MPSSELCDSAGLINDNLLSPNLFAIISRCLMYDSGFPEQET